MTAREMITIGDFLTNDEIKEAIKLYLSNSDTFHKLCVDTIINPNLDRILKSLGKTAEPDDLADALEFALMSSSLPENLTEAEN